VKTGESESAFFAAQKTGLSVPIFLPAAKRISTAIPCAQRAGCPLCPRVAVGIKKKRRFEDGYAK
jgi:hypothetical protein